MAGETTHAGKSGHGLTNILTLHSIGLTSALSTNIIRTVKIILLLYAGLTNTMLVPPAICMNIQLVATIQSGSYFTGWFQLLLKHGASKTIRDQDGLTPLDVSLQHGDDNDVAKLLQQESN